MVHKGDPTISHNDGNNRSINAEQNQKADVRVKLLQVGNGNVMNIQNKVRSKFLSLRTETVNFF